MKQIGFKHIEFDIIAKKQVNPVFNLTQDQSIDINRGKAPLEIENYFINEVHKAAGEALRDGKIIIEGTISNERVLRKIFSGLLANYTFIYLYPIHKDKYKQRIMDRFDDDVINNKQTLPIWDFIDSRIVDSYKQSGFASSIVVDYINHLTNKLFYKGHDRYKAFIDMGFKIKTIAV